MQIHDFLDFCDIRFEKGLIGTAVSVCCPIADGRRIWLQKNIFLGTVLDDGRFGDEGGSRTPASPVENQD